MSRANERARARAEVPHIFGDSKFQGAEGRLCENMTRPYGRSHCGPSCLVKWLWSRALAGWLLDSKSIEASVLAIQSLMISR